MILNKDLVAASATPLVLAILAEGDSYGRAAPAVAGGGQDAARHLDEGVAGMTPVAGSASLEEQISLWREYLRRRRAIHGPDVQELEDRLRDQVAALVVLANLLGEAQ